MATQIARFARAATQNRLRRTPLLSRRNRVVFKRRRHRIVYNDTVTDRPRGFGIVARTKFPRCGKKGGGGCGRRPGRRPLKLK